MTGRGEQDIDLAGAQILIVDDVPANLDVLADSLEEAGYDVSVAPGGEVALRNARATQLDLILLDVVMPGMDGYETCRQLKAAPETRDIPVLFITARAEIEGVVEGFAAGGVDYITKPFRKEEVLVRVQTHLEKARLTRALQEKNRALEEEIARRQQATSERNHLAEQLSHIARREAERWGVAGFVAQSPTMQQIFHEVDLLQSANNTAALIVGESGTGKELIARAIHFGGPGAEDPFVPVNCAAIPANLAESQFFGHVKGAFTGADEDRIGYFELAHGGTLFLDEIGEMPVEIQPKLLRALEDGRIVPVGGKEERVVEVRTIAATNADLRASLAEGTFRQDLYYRLLVFPLDVPPLRERTEDIGLLADYFLAALGRPEEKLPAGAVSRLRAYGWPGNVRELRNLIERAHILAGGGPIKEEHLLLEVGSSGTARAGSDPGEGDLNLANNERRLVLAALKRADGNKSLAAKMLGITRRTLYSRLKLLDLTDQIGKGSESGNGD